MKNKTALVTGASRGIGRGVALELARHGYDIAVVCTKVDPAVTDRGPIEVQKRIEDLGRRAVLVAGDIADCGQHERMLAEALSGLGHIDVLVNNAGVAPLQRLDIHECTEESYDRVLGINLRGPFFFTQAAARWMLDHDGGVVVNIIDESAINPGAFLMQHAASKTALWMLTRSCALALAPAIRVNAVLPGAVLKPPNWTEERWQNITPSVPLKKLGSAEDVARAVVYLVKEDYITGQMIVVDGGSSLRR